MEEESWRRNHGGGILEEESWRRNHGGCILEEESLRRYPGGGIMRRNDGTQAPRRHPGSTQEAPSRTQEAPRRHPGGTQEARDILDTECVFSYAPAHKSDATDHFRVHGSDVTITVYRACAQEFVNAGAKITGSQIPNTEDTLPEPLQQRLFGE